MFIHLVGGEGMDLVQHPMYRLMKCNEILSIRTDLLENNSEIDNKNDRSLQFLQNVLETMVCKYFQSREATLCHCKLVCCILFTCL